MSKAAIILVGGKASRFSGLYKELLPVGENRAVIDSSIDKVRGYDRIIIVSSPEKIAVHTRHFAQSKYADLPIMFVPTLGELMFDGIKAALPFTLSFNALLMGDTVFGGELETRHDYLSFGTFLTFTPSQYSVFIDGKIQTKPTNCKYRNAAAWGCFTFNKGVAEYWLTFPSMHYDDVLNTTVYELGCNSFPIADYYDLGTFERYREYLCQL